MSAHAFDLREELRERIQTRCRDLQPGSCFTVTVGEIRAATGYDTVRDLVEGAGCSFYLGSSDYIVFKPQH